MTPFEKAVVAAADAAYNAMDKDSEGIARDVLTAALSALEAEGWVMVPKEPTEEMIHHCGSAMKNYIRTLPPEDRVAKWGTASMPRKHGYWIKPKEKAAVRYRAMLAARPSIKRGKDQR